MDWFVINMLNGLSYGMVLFLIASGMSIVLGAMGITNLAHGAFYMVGAYAGWTVAVQWKATFGLGLLAGGLAAGIVGLTIERGLIRRLYKQPNEQVLLTFGFVYILTNLCLWTWGGWPRPPFTAKFLLGSMEIMGRSFPKARIAIIVVGFVLAIGLWWLQDKTRAGAIVRAGMDDKETTMGLGINLELAFAVICDYRGRCGFHTGRSTGRYSYRGDRCIWKGPFPATRHVFHVPHHDRGHNRPSYGSSWEKNIGDDYS
jgi:branched-chain amino acid transport system permease protein